MRSLGVALCLLTLLASGCGRYWFDPGEDGGERPDSGAADGATSTEDDGGGVTTPRDGGGTVMDDGGGTAVDASPSCPMDMVAVPVDPPFCIDLMQSPPDTWTNAGMICAGRGKRLCADTEWYEACLQATELGIPDMVGDYEWVAELVTPTEGGKRGYLSCEDESAHEIFVDPYVVRCCADL
jgi:hypothetical protein